MIYYHLASDDGVHSPTWAELLAHFKYTIAHRLYVAQVAQRCLAQAGG
jgi:hypothetical protein